LRKCLAAKNVRRRLRGEKRPTNPSEVDELARELRSEHVINAR
jgi:hypothetical protein